ncbi:MAG: D-alanyl-D-alanine carboxypeptidase family protein [Sphingomonas sp.]
MPISLDGLDHDFRAKLGVCLAHCADRGAVMVPYFGIRTPIEQGALWRQSRSVQEVAARIAELHAKGAPYLAHAIDAAGPRHGPHVTNAVPGYSWHQWGEAMDCFGWSTARPNGAPRSAAPRTATASTPIRRQRRA